MREVRLYDPERRPPNWMGHIRQGEYALFFKDTNSGQEMKADGMPVLRPEEVPSCGLSATQERGAFLGWNTWMQTARRHPLTVSTRFTFFTRAGPQANRRESCIPPAVIS